MVGRAGLYKAGPNAGFVAWFRAGDGAAPHPTPPRLARIEPHFSTALTPTLSYLLLVLVLCGSLTRSAGSPWMYGMAVLLFPFPTCWAYRSTTPHLADPPRLQLPSNASTCPSPSLNSRRLPRTCQRTGWWAFLLSRAVSIPNSGSPYKSQSTILLSPQTPITLSVCVGCTEECLRAGTSNGWDCPKALPSL